MTRSLLLRLLALALAALSPAALPLYAQVPPSVPAARFYGSVVISGLPAYAAQTVTARGAAGTFCGTGPVSGGTYSIDVQASSACAGSLTFFVDGQQADQVAVVPNSLSGAVVLNLTVSGGYPYPYNYPYNPYGPPVPPPALNAATGTVTYQPGWNLVAGPPGTVVSSATSQVFTFQPGDGSYETLPSSSGLQTGYGYWVLFPATTTVNLPPTGLNSVSRIVPAGQQAMIGNPFNQPATISGASKVYTYDPLHGYQSTTILLPGQGAWVTGNIGPVVISAA